MFTKICVDAPTLNIRHRMMKVSEARKLCKANGLGFWIRGRVMMTRRKLHSSHKVRRYNLTTGEYETSSVIALVPFGTIMEFGCFKFP